MLKAGKLDRKVTILRREMQQESTYGTMEPANADGYAAFVTVWAEVQDLLPSRGERIADGISIARRPCRVRIRYMDGITSDMRLEIGTRTLRIVSQPAELGRRDGLEFVAEELTTEGQEP